MKVSYQENDGAKLFEALTLTNADVYSVLSSIEGPYAFAFYRVSSPPIIPSLSSRRILL